MRAFIVPSGLHAVRSNPNHARTVAAPADAAFLPNAARATALHRRISTGLIYEGSPEAAASICAATPLGRPALAQIAARTLRFVPAVALTSVDPLWSLA